MTARRPYTRPTTFRVMCPDCGETLHHKCHDPESSGSLRGAFLKFLTWVPEFGLYPEVEKAMTKAGRAAGWLEKDQDFTDHAFFGAQPWTYAMGDKHFGRDFSGEIDRLIRAAGLDPDELRQVAYRKMDQDREEKAKQEERREKLREDEKKAVKVFQSKSASLDEKIAVLDEIIAKKTATRSPYEDEEDRHVSDPFLSDTLKHLKDRYEGGINPEVNRLRIEAARKIAMDTGVYGVSLSAADGEMVFSRRFQTKEQRETFLKEIYANYDAFSEIPFARAVLARLSARGGYEETVTYARGPKGWAALPKKKGTY